MSALIFLGNAPLCAADSLEKSPATIISQTTRIDLFSTESAMQTSPYTSPKIVAPEDASYDAAEDRRRIAELEDEIAELSAHIDAATYRLLRAIAEFDQRQGWADGFRSCAHWLSVRVGIELVTAREKVRVARTLEGLPRISQELCRGRISYSKVREMTRVATPENEESLVDLARAGTASHVQRVVRAFRRCEQDALDAAERQREGRYLSLRTDEDGMLVLEGRLPAEVGAVLTRALEAAEQELRKRSRDASAEASGDLDLATTASVTNASVTKASATKASAENASAKALGASSTAGQRRADALGLVAEQALTSTSDVGRASPYQVVLHVDHQVLAEPDSKGGTCHIENGPALSAETARRLSCDAPVVTLTEDDKGQPQDKGQPLDVGRKTRRVNAALFRALKTRDPTCQFPGCEAASRLTPHHISHWAAGGPTNKDNLCLLCGAHHWSVHEGGFEVLGRAPNELTFFTPSGIELKLHHEPPLLPSDPVAALEAQHAAEKLDITPETNTISWQGERLDLSLALDALLP
jgi:hypothetical protein